MTSNPPTEPAMPLGTLEEQVARYQQVLDVMPAGVILLDTQGVVREANPEAQKLLEVPLVGSRWFEVIQHAFAPREDDGHEISLRNGRKVRLAISASATGQLILITDLTETRLLQSRISDLQRALFARTHGGVAGPSGENASVECHVVRFQFGGAESASCNERPIPIQINGSIARFGKTGQ